MLRWVDAETGTGGMIEGIAFSQSGETVQVSPSGAFILTRLEGETVAKVYRIDWETHTVTPDGAIPVPEQSDLAINGRDQVLVTPEGGLSKAYQLSANGSHALVGLYDLKLPESVHIISWNTP
jgi:hypothetical protein